MVIISNIFQELTRWIVSYKLMIYGQENHEPHADMVRLFAVTILWYLWKPSIIFVGSLHITLFIVLFIPCQVAQLAQETYNANGLQFILEINPGLIQYCRYCLKTYRNLISNRRRMLHSFLTICCAVKLVVSINKIAYPSCEQGILKRYIIGYSAFPNSRVFVCETRNSDGSCKRVWIL